MLRYGRRVCGHLATRPIHYLCLGLCLSTALSERTAQSALRQGNLGKLSNDADFQRSAPCFGRRRAPAPQKHQASSTCTARIAAVRSAGRRGHLRIRKRITTASSSRILLRVAPDRPWSRRPTDAAACHRPTPVAPVRTPREADRHSPTRAGRGPGLGAARGRGPRHRDGAAAARAQGRRGGGRGDLQPGRERPVARPAQEPAALGS